MQTRRRRNLSRGLAALSLVLASVAPLPAAVSGAAPVGVVRAADNPCTPANPCAPRKKRKKAGNPCAPSNPCAPRKKKAKNPCAASQRFDGRTATA